MGQEENPSKGVYDKIGLAIFIIASSLLGVSTNSIYDAYQLTGVALAWVALGFASLVALSVKLWSDNKQLKSNDAKNRMTDELFLTKLMDPYLECGQDFVIPKSEYISFSFPIESDMHLEIMAFSQKKFNIVIVDEDNAKALDDAMLNERGRYFTSGLLKKYRIQHMAFSDDVTHIKLRYNVVGIKKIIDWKVYIENANRKDEQDIVVNLLISNLPLMQSNKQTKLEVK